MKKRQKIETGCVGTLGALFLGAALTQYISLGQPYYEIYVEGEIGIASCRERVCMFV